VKESEDIGFDPEPALASRLGLLPEWYNWEAWECRTKEAGRLPPKADDYDRAWGKFSQADSEHLAALACYYANENERARLHGRRCLEASREFLFGDWRTHFQAQDTGVDAAWWKRRFVWMQVFEGALLWASVLGKWDYLTALGSFPEADSCISDGYTAEDRDWYVALGAFLRKSPPPELETLLIKAEGGKLKRSKLLGAVTRACLARDGSDLQTTLVEFLRHYRRREFPRQNITKKITLEGTLFTHWAEKEKLEVTVPSDYADHIVRLAHITTP
jgi:hypothetical protein